MLSILSEISTQSIRRTVIKFYGITNDNLKSTAGQIANGSSFNNSNSGQNDNLWQGVNGVNNLCPSGFRLPTSTEVTA